MNRLGKRCVFAVVAVCALGAGLYFTHSDAGRVAEGDLPAFDLRGIEPQVSASITESRANLLEYGASAERWADLAQRLHAHEFHAAAVACYARAAALAPRDYRWPYLAGLAQSELDLRTAPAHYEAAAGLRPDNPAFYVNWGNLLQQLDRGDEAKTCYGRALELDASSSHALHGLTRIALIEGDLASARSLLDRARAAAPTEAEGHVLRAQLLAREGQREASKREAELAEQAGTPTRAYDPVVAAMELTAVSSKALSRRGVHLAGQGDFVGAEREFRRVLAIRSGSAQDHANLAGALARQRKTKEAIAQYRRALQITPDDAGMLNSLGMVLVESGDAEGGTALLQRALKVDATHYEVHHNLGLASARHGDMERAIAHYREALRLRPAATRVSNDLGTALARQGKLTDAVRVWEQALAEDPGNLSIRYNLGVACMTQGRHADAIAHLEEGRRRAPDSSRFQGLLAWELATAPEAELRDGARSLAMARRVFAAAPADAQSADLLAAALAETGRFEEATGVLENALTARKAPNPALAREIERRAALYRKGQPYRQPLQPR